MPRRQVTVVFSDVNGKEIERVEHRTNDYGSFSGSVTAPRDRLMGQMYLNVRGGAARFDASHCRRIQASEVPGRNRRSQGRRETRMTIVKLQGTATAYTGAAINDAKVSWRVVRQVQYPSLVVLALLVDAAASRQQPRDRSWHDGDRSRTVRLTFNSPRNRMPRYLKSPNRRSSTRSMPMSPTRPAKRDRQQRTVNVGYTALAASMSADDWLTDNEPVEITDPHDHA